ncbi:MAG: hypothetical protein AAGB23_13680 [Pseudomonadota bacterium]
MELPLWLIPAVVGVVVAFCFPRFQLWKIALGMVLIFFLLLGAIIGALAMTWETKEGLGFFLILIIFAWAVPVQFGFIFLGALVGRWARRFVEPPRE